MDEQIDNSLKEAAREHENKSSENPILEAKKLLHKNLKSSPLCSILFGASIPSSLREEIDSAISTILARETINISGNESQKVYVTNHYGFYNTQSSAGKDDIEELNDSLNCVEDGRSNGNFLSPLGDGRVAEETTRRRKSLQLRQRSSSSKTRFYESGEKHRPKPGVVSEELRCALGLRSDELPMWIYRMRIFGYPPGYVEEAKHISNELIMHNEPDTPTIRPTISYDHDEFINYPGFNTPPPSRTRDEFRRYDSPQYNNRFSLKNTFPQELFPQAKKQVKPKRARKTSLEDLEARREELERELNEYKSDEDIEAGQAVEEMETIEPQKALNVESKTYYIPALNENKPSVSSFAKNITPYEHTLELEEPPKERNIMSVISEINKNYQERYFNEVDNDSS